MTSRERAEEIVFYLHRDDTYLSAEQQENEVKYIAAALDTYADEKLGIYILDA